MTHLRAAADPRAGLSELLVRATRAFTWEELASLSSVGRVRAALNNGSLVRLAPNAFAGAAHAGSFAVRADAALLWAGPDSALSGIAALYSWSLVDEPPEVIDLLVPHGRRIEPPDWIRLRRSRGAFSTTRRNGATVVRPERAVVLGYGLLAPRSRDGMVFRAAQSRLTTPRRMLRELESVPRVRARRDLARVLDSCLRGAESYLEEHGVRRVFVGREYDRFIRQHRVFANGEFYRLDMYDPATMLDVELDGARFHDAPDQRQNDRRRDAELATLGIQTIRLSYADLTERPEWCRRIVSDVVRARRTLTLP